MVPTNGARMSRLESQLRPESGDLAKLTRIPGAVARRVKTRVSALSDFLKTIDEVRKTDALGRRVAIAEFDGFRVVHRANTADEKLLAGPRPDEYFDMFEDLRLPPDSVVIDVGAHIGTFALNAARLAPQGRVWAIEASQEGATLVSINAELNGLSNVHACHVALAAERGVVRLNYAPGTWGHSTIARRAAGGEDVEAVTLTEFMEDHRIDKCDFAKLNVEGAEFSILLASDVATLRRFSRLLIHYHLDLAPGSDLAELEEHLVRADFDVERRPVNPDRGVLVVQARSLA